jgi:DNA-binding response OmpR family regulator
MENEQLLLKTLKSLSILYIEDEDRIREDMTQTLQILCSEVYSYHCANKALEEYENISPHIIFSDISLGESSGLELAKQIRAFDKKIPIILLSAHTDTKYLLEATKLKLVAYLTKPISFEELKTTLLDAVSEIDIEEHKAIFTIEKDLVFDTFHKVLYKNKKEITLTKKELELLELLIKKHKKTISPEEIKATLWSDSYYATDAALKAVIHKLRSKIGKEKIKNLSGVGYYLNIE